MSAPTIGRDRGTGEHGDEEADATVVHHERDA